MRGGVRRGRIFVAIFKNMLAKDPGVACVSKNDETQRHMGVVIPSRKLVKLGT